MSDETGPLWPYAPPPESPPRPPDPPASPRGLVALPVVVLLLAGAVAGLLWPGLTPRVPLVETASAITFPALEGKRFLGADAWFLVVSVVFGLASGVLGWAALRRRGPWAAVGIGVGGLLAALTARAVGARVVVSQALYDVCDVADPAGLCSIYDGRIRLRATGLLVAWPVVALLTFAVLTAWRDRQSVQVSSG